MAGRPKEHVIAGSAAGGGMGGRISSPEVGLDFHHSPGQPVRPVAAYQNLAQLVARNAPGIPIKELR
jgi:hypothetical protein